MSTIRGSESVRIDGDDLLLDLSDGSTVRVTLEDTNSPNELSQHFDGGGWPCWKIDDVEYASVMLKTVDGEDE